MERFDDFIKESIYLKGVSPATIEWYKDALTPGAATAAVSPNNLSLPCGRPEQKILSTISPEQISRLIHWKPVGANQTRAHIIALVALDTGLG